MRVALGIAYRGTAYSGWQSQPGGRTVQDHVDAALSAFADAPLESICAGRTDAGVHALNQVVHFDTGAVRGADAWVRGTNRYLPADIAVQWCRFVPDTLPLARAGDRPPLRLPAARVAGPAGARSRPRRMDLSRPRRRGDAHGRAGARRPARLQRLSLGRVPGAHAGQDDARGGDQRRGAYWRFRFDADAFLHHMIRNLVGSLVAVGSGARPAAWLAAVLAGSDRSLAAATFAPDGLYFVGPYYDPAHGLPDRTAAMDWLP